MPGWHTKRKIVVFESDDWGMSRMKSPEAYKRLLAKGYPVNQCVYNRNDTLENNDDLQFLLEILASVKDKNGKNCLFTLNNVVANPHFERIKKNNFQQYYYEPFTETLKRYPNHDKVLNLYKEGIQSNLFQIQFHGREHINVNRWLKNLQDNNLVLLDAIREDMFTVANSPLGSGRRDFLDAFGEGYEIEYENLKEILCKGADLFEQIWGFRSKSFIAPCYAWSPTIENVLRQIGVRYLQGTHVQRFYKKGSTKVFKKYHYLGQRNHLNQRYLIRNVYFEPSEFSGTDVVDNALNAIDLAFNYYKPAVICSHRVNYIGGIRQKNRDHNLKKLKILLKKLLKKHPDVEFMSSDELGELIEKK